MDQVDGDLCSIWTSNLLALGQKQEVACAQAEVTHTGHRNGVAIEDRLGVTVRVVYRNGCFISCKPWQAVLDRSMWLLSGSRDDVLGHDPRTLNPRISQVIGATIVNLS